MGGMANGNVRTYVYIHQVPVLGVHGVANVRTLVT